MRILCLFDKSGCCFWRSYQPLKALQEAGLADVKFLELRTSSKKDVADALANTDVVHMLGLMDTDGLLMLRQWQRLGLKVVVDYDDLHYNVSPFNTAYRRFGMEDVQVRDPSTGDVKYLWKDGTNDFDIKKNKLRFHAYQAILGEADLVTCTTVYLKDALLEINPTANVAVLPNAVDMDVWKPFDIRDKYPDKFRFGWAVSGSHGEDWIAIRPALLEFLKTHKDAKFVCIGDTYMDIKSGMEEVKDQIEWYPFSNLWEGHYALRIPLLGLDAAIMPLADIEFNKCKSPLKFAEMTAFGWPVIAQKTLPYSECIVNGYNGLLADTTDAWVRCLDTLYRDANVRAKLHFEARQTVKELFDLKEVIKEYRSIYRDLLGDETCRVLTSYTKQPPSPDTPLIAPPKEL